jgi:hypothetical protein
VITRINLLRALNPSEGYPRFNFAVSVDGMRYDLVLPSAIADWLNVCCTGDERAQMDEPAAGDEPEDLRVALAKQTSREADRDHLLYGQLEIEAVTHVRADRLCETAEYRYLFVSRGIARQLCHDAEAHKLPPELAKYVLQHRSVLTTCGGFELLVVCYQHLDVDTYLKDDTLVLSRISSSGELEERRALLRELLRSSVRLCGS